MHVQYTYNLQDDIEFGHFDFSNSKSVKENHSVHWGTNPLQKYQPTLLLVFAKPILPPLNLLKTFQASLFGQFPPIYCFLVNSPLKIRFFSKPSKY